MISEKIPRIQVVSINGDSEYVTDVINKKRSILLFYRGGWCPYCNAHLSAVGQVQEEIQELGFQVIAIAPDSPAKLKEAMQKAEIDYDLYSDASGELITAMGLAFRAPERKQQQLNNYSNGQNPGLLPVPALYVVGTDGTILFAYVSPDYKHRISADLLLDVLKDLDREQD